LQQISADNTQQYFIFGIKFDDIYIPVPEENNINNINKFKIFIYEKTYLFISNETLCKFFLNIFQFIINYKKLNFLKYLPDFDSLLYNEIISNFNKKNEESVRTIY
jgi:hypothetical protein